MKQLKQAGHVTAVATVIVVLAGVAGIGYTVLHHHKTKVATVVTSQPSNTPATNNGNGDQTAITSGSDDTSLNQDLQGINGSMGQENSDTTAANSGLNDQQNQIAVPTN